MNLLLAGFLPRDELTFDLFLKRFMPTWRWQGQSARRDAALPAADMVLIDLAAHGCAGHGEAALAQLALLTGDTAAILLTSPHDTSWQSALASLRDNWVLLAKPYNAEAMRAALSRAADIVKSQQRRRTPANSLSQLATKTVANVAHLPMPMPTPVPTAAVTLLEKVSVTAAAPSRAAPNAVHGMHAAELALYLADVSAERQVLLRKLLAGLQARLPFEVRFTMQHFLIIHPADDWVASNTPMPVVLRVAGSDALATAVSVRTLALAQVEDRLHQLGIVPHDLSEFLLELLPHPISPARTDTTSRI